MMIILLDSVRQGLQRQICVEPPRPVVPCQRRVEREKRYVRRKQGNADRLV